MIIPPVFITFYPNNTSASGGSRSIVLSNLAVTQSGIITEFAPLQWNTYLPRHSAHRNGTSLLLDNYQPGNMWQLVWAAV